MLLDQKATVLVSAEPHREMFESLKSSIHILQPSNIVRAVKVCCECSGKRFEGVSQG